MTYDFRSELTRVQKYYNADALQKRFSALITGESGSGKTFLFRTCRFPVHIDSFDPGGTKCLKPWIDSGDIIVDTTYENEDPFDPKVFADWMKNIEIRMKIKYFDHFGTYGLDSATSWGEAVMNYQLNSSERAGQAPMRNRDYNPQKILMINYIKKLMNIPCDFIVTGHLKTIENIIGVTKEGHEIKKLSYRFYTTGQAMVTIPMQFDELYVAVGESSSTGVRRELLVDSQGQYIARSRLKSEGKLLNVEDPNIKKILKKIGLTWEDKPRLEKLQTT